MKAVVFVALGAIGACMVEGHEAGVADRKRPQPDAPSGEASGVYDCHAKSSPDQTCSAPSACCFDDSPAHYGACSAAGAACASYGTLTCDGPEDCPTGEKCCATVTGDGVYVGCEAACLSPFDGGDELCHEPSICSDGRWCVTADGTQPALPPTVSICR